MRVFLCSNSLKNIETVLIWGDTGAMRHFVLLALLVASSSAFAAQTAKNADQNGQYWQRISVSDATHQRGVYAQKMLNKNIAECVVELEMRKDLGDVKAPLKNIAQPRTEKAYKDLETVQHPAGLLDEFGSYSNFEGCMYAKGWERVKYVPYDVASEARKNYMINHVDYDDPATSPAFLKQKVRKSNHSVSTDWSDLND